VPAWVSHHNVHFGTAWEEAFDDLDAGRTMGGPSRFVTFASLSDPTAAPDGCHGLFVLEPVPNLDADLDWNTATPALTERMLGWLESVGYPPAATDLVQTVDPPQWRRRGADRGTPFSLAHTFAQSGPFRPGPTDRRLPGVYFVGAGTRPGVGIPMVVISGQIAAQRIRSTS